MEFAQHKKLMDYFQSKHKKAQILKWESLTQIDIKKQYTTYIERQLFYDSLKQ